MSTFGALILNRDSFTGRDLVDKDGDSAGEKLRKWSSYLWRQAVPAIAPGNYHSTRAIDALAHETGVQWSIPHTGIGFTGKDYKGMPVQAKHALGATFGVKIRPVDLADSAQRQANSFQHQLRESRVRMSQSAKRLNKGAITREQHQHTLELERQKQRRLTEKLRQQRNSIAGQALDDEQQ